MGVDTNALDIQVEEKKRRKAAEAAAEQAYANSISQIKNLLEERNLMDNEEAIEEAIKTRAVWDVQQQQTTERSTFDLNDPNELKKRPKWTDADVVGPSSMRRFAGEDLFAGDRKKIQASQMKDWCTQIESEKRIKKEKEKQEMLRHSNYLMQVDQIRNEMNKIECEQRMSDNFKTAETNAQLVEMRKAERQAEKEQNILLNKMQSDKIQNDPMLCESRSQGKSVIEGRVRRDHWKGMTVSQLQAIQAENYQVILEKQDRMARERDAEVQRSANTDSVVDILQQRYDAERAEKVAEAMQYKLDQAVQIHEKKNRDVELNKLYNTNTVTDGFFNRFGSNCR